MKIGAKDATIDRLEDGLCLKVCDSAKSIFNPCLFFLLFFPPRPIFPQNAGWEMTG